MTSAQWGETGKHLLFWKEQIETGCGSCWRESRTFGRLSSVWKQRPDVCVCVLLTRSLSVLPPPLQRSSCSSRSSRPPARAAARWWRHTSSPQTRWTPVPWSLTRQRRIRWDILYLCTYGKQTGFNLYHEGCGRRGTAVMIHDLLFWVGHNSPESCCRLSSPTWHHELKVTVRGCWSALICFLLNLLIICCLFPSKEFT